MRRFFKFRKFEQSTSGVAAIEFAILLPFLIIVLFGVYQITTYISAVRKIDNATNDIAYIISREGCIADDLTGDCATTTNYSGGETELERIFDNVTPYLIYPYSYNPTDGSSQIEAKLVGLPINWANTPTCPIDSLNHDTLRLMWEEKYPPTSATSVTPDSNIPPALCNGLNCPNACTGALYNSLYKDNSGDRANMIYPGQSFILVNFAFRFQALLGGNFIGIVLPQNIEKIASYATRTRYDDINKDGKIEPNEVLNNMQFCTNCNVYSSTFNGGINPMASSGNAVRQICDATLLATGAYSNSGGCAFY